MSTNATLSVRANTLVEGVCYADEQERLNNFARNLIINLPGTYNTFNYGSSTPAVEDRDKPWFRTTDGRWYDWNSTYGKWVSRHPDFEGKGIIWYGSIASIDTMDGGSSGTVTPVTGPMWSVVSEIAGRFPIGVGNLPDSATSITVGATGGHDQITQTEAQMPPHYHTITDLESRITAGSNAECMNNPNNPTAAGSFPDLVTDSKGSGEAMDIISPYLGVYFLVKTARTFFAI